MIKHFNIVCIRTFGILHQMNGGKMKIFISSGIILMKNIVSVTSHLLFPLTLCTVTQGWYWGSAWGSCAVWSPLWVSCRTVVSNMAFGWIVSLSFIWLFILFPGICNISLLCSSSDLCPLCVIRSWCSPLCLLNVVFLGGDGRIWICNCCIWSLLDVPGTGFEMVVQFVRCTSCCTGAF